jgi:hypothetical protein
MRGCKSEGLLSVRPGHRLVIGALTVCVSSHRSGVGTALMMVIEEGGRSRGAAVVALETNLLTDLSAPF